MSLEAHETRAAGARIYNSLTDAQREHLQHVLVHGGISASPTVNSQWRETVERLVTDCIRKKMTHSGEPADDLDVAALVDEVLPAAHAAIPVPVRQELFQAVLDVTVAAGETK
mmetsp:Transcript_62873/g.73161  ORF Transcript_62873/g.73161 Transcript_62873/m.73161 type:complete len:113 (-) Transcript_62873:88-426(-)